MDYKKTLLDQTVIMARHLPFTKTELMLMPTFERNYYWEMLMEQLEK